MTETTTINPDEMAALPVGAVVRENMMREGMQVASVDYVKMEGEIWRCTAASGAAAPFFDHVATFPPTPTSEFGTDYGLGINSVFELVSSSEEEAA